MADCFEIGAVNRVPGSARRYKTGTWRSVRPVITESKCIRCQLCYTYCPDSAIIVAPDGSVSVDYDYCKGCGICANECPKEAIKMEPEVK